MSDCSVTTFDLLRHGEPEGGNRFRGTVDSPLTPKGRQQLQTVFSTLDSHQLNHIICSPKQRCAAMSEKWAQQLNIPLKKETELREIDFGRWEGQTVEAIQQQESENLKTFWQAPEAHTPHDGESLQDFDTRISACWKKIQQDYKNQHCLLVTHGGVIRSILGSLLTIPLENLTRIEVPHSCWTRICIYHTAGKPDWPQLVFHNQQPQS